MKSWGIGLLSAVMALAAQSALADALSTLYNTGVDNNRNPIADQAVDPHYRLISSGDAVYPGPAAYATTPIPSPPWVANSSTSRWIGARPDGNGEVVPGQYTYRLEFDLPGLIPSTASLSGLWGTDDVPATILLNGVDKFIPTGGFAGLTAFTITGDFKPGTNTLDFVVTNGGTTPNPHGLRVEGLTGSGAAPTINLSTAYNQTTQSTIAHGSLDDNWQLIAAPLGVTLGAAKSIEKVGPWFGAEPNARWIGPQDAANGSAPMPVGDYTYEYSFNLNRVGKLYALKGNFGSDNQVVTMTVNGNTVMSNTGGFSAPLDLPTTTDELLFADGANSVQITVQNGGTSGNPHGLHLSAWIEEAASTAPFANANGPYNIDRVLGDMLNLDGSASFDVDVAAGDSLTLFEWDIDGDGSYDFSSAAATLSLDQSQYAPFLTNNGAYEGLMRVWDATGLSSTSDFQIFVVPEPASLMLLATGLTMVLVLRRRSLRP